MIVKTRDEYRGTQVSDFLRCPKRYDYAWVQGLEAKQRNEKLTIGSAIHKFLELWYADHRALDAMDAMREYIIADSTALDETQVQDMLMLCTGIATNYVQHYGIEPNWTVIATEKSFSEYLGDCISYTGTIDMLVQDEDGKYWIVDHKTTTNLDIYDKNSDMDRQISRYWWAIERNLDIDIEGFIYNIILKELPVEPKILKSGQLSKDKSQKTTAKLYRAAIEYHGLNEEDYADFLQYLEEQPKEFFRRIKVERCISEMRAAIDEMKLVIYDIQAKEYSGRWYRNITKDCHWDCPFKTLCVAEMDGSNANHIRKELFTVKEEV